MSFLKRLFPWILVNVLATIYCGYQLVVEPQIYWFVFMVLNAFVVLMDVIRAREQP